MIRSLFCQENIQNGVFFWQGPIFHTYSHSDEDFEKTICSVENSLKTLKIARTPFGIFKSNILKAKQFYTNCEIEDPVKYADDKTLYLSCLLYTSPSPRD